MIAAPPFLATLRAALRSCAAALALIALVARPAAAQDVVVCQTANGARTPAELAEEVRIAGYAGPWDAASVAAAYARASGGAVLCGEPAPAALHRIAVVFVAGYGSDLAIATAMFSPLRTALAARNSNITFVQYSYRGTTFNGCAATASPYRPSDTAQDVEDSERMLREMLVALKDACEVERIVIVGHSLGGLIAFLALGGQSETGVSDLVTIDSPLGGVPLTLMRTCIDAGLCPDGVVVPFLAGRYSEWSGTAMDNAATAASFEAAQTRVSAWGNQSDCFYAVALCGLSGRRLGAYDARETQWAGIPRTVRKDYPFAAYVWNIPASHTAVLLYSAAEIAEDLLP